MDFKFFDTTPEQLKLDCAKRVRMRRKEMGLTQLELASKAGGSLGSVKRFENTGEASFGLIVNIAIALNCSEDIEMLFSKKKYHSIEEIINERS